MPKVSQKDISKELNISRVTVTKALQDHPDIALNTRQLVKNKAAEMGYFPDFIGRSLSKGQTFNIGLVLPKIAHSFFSTAVENFYKYANKKGYNVIPMISFENSKIEAQNIRTLLSMGVDGIIIDISGSAPQNKIYDLINKSGTKFLFFDRAPINSLENSVAINDWKAAYQMTNLIIEKGYKNICHFTGPDGISIIHDRRKGYEDAMNQVKLEVNVVKTNMVQKDGYDIFMKLAEKGRLPQAIFAVNDSLANGIYKAASELGLNIPGDIAVAGFGNIETSKLLQPPLTTVNIPVEEMTEFAINKLIGMIQDKDVEKDKKVFSGELIIRGSI